MAYWAEETQVEPHRSLSQPHMRLFQQHTLFLWIQSNDSFARMATSFTIAEFTLNVPSTCFVHAYSGRSWIVPDGSVTKDYSYTLEGTLEEQ